MKKRYSIGWLIGIVVFLTVAGIALTLIPLRACSLCTVAPPKPPRKWMSTRAGPGAPLLCPQCNDRGKVSIAKARGAQRPSARVAEIIALHKYLEGSNVGHVLDRMILDQGGDPQVVMGRKHFTTLSNGEARFVASGNRSGLLVVLGETRSILDRASMVLISPEGRVTDVLHATCGSPTATLEVRILEGQEPNGAVACFVKTVTRPDFPPEFDWYGPAGRLRPERIPAAHRRSPTTWEYRIGVEGDRLSVK